MVANRRELTQLFHTAGLTTPARTQVDGVDAGDAFDGCFVDEFGRGLCDQLTDKWDVGFTYGVAQKTVVADPREAVGQDVHKEPTQELCTIKAERCFPGRVLWVAAGEGDAVFVCVIDAGVGDANPVCIASEVLQHLLGAAKGALAENHPGLFVERIQRLVMLS